jgi:MFS transporter, SP family, solute carrier family 2 (myo-inositol transporter), member 13
LGWLFCLFFYPETAGLSLEEVIQIFEDGYGIRRAEELRKHKAQTEDRVFHGA